MQKKITRNLDNYIWKNSKVFEQKGSLLSFNVNIDPKLSKNAKKISFMTFVSQSEPI